MVSVSQHRTHTAGVQAPCFNACAWAPAQRTSLNGSRLSRLSRVYFYGADKFQEVKRLLY